MKKHTSPPLKKLSDPIGPSDADHAAKHHSRASTHPTEHRLPALPRPAEADGQQQSSEQK
jgi:hypothetical protein